MNTPELITQLVTSVTLGASAGGLLKGHRLAGASLAAGLAWTYPNAAIAAAALVFALLLYRRFSPGDESADVPITIKPAPRPQSAATKAEAPITENVLDVDFEVVS